MTREHGPGVSWLAARTGKGPSEPRSSPAKFVGAALREIARLAAEAESADPAVREAAEEELGALREQIAAAPPPSEAFLTTVAATLRDAAERLRRDNG